MNNRTLPIIQVGNVLVSADIITNFFCCDLDKCQGQCCVEGDAGAPLDLDEIAEVESCLDAVWDDMAASAQAVVDKQGVAYPDADGEMVTSIVNGRDCMFTCYENGVCLCALEKAFRKGITSFCKPISCSLYPIREKRFSNGCVGLNYHEWNVCRDAVILGRQKNIRIYQFLKAPLVRRFGEDWYDELECVAKEVIANQESVE